MHTRHSFRQTMLKSALKTFFIVLPFIVALLKLRLGQSSEEIIVEKTVVTHKSTEIDEDFRRKLQSYFEFREARSFPDCSALIEVSIFKYSEYSIRPL